MTSTPDTIYLSIAGFNFAISFTPCRNQDISRDFISKLDTEVKKFFKDFTISSPPKRVHFTIELERKYPLVLNKKNKKFLYFYEVLSGRIITHQHISFPQFIIILRFALQKLLAKGKGILFHASASKIRNKAVLFTGQGGAGKSTVVNLLKETHPILADDCLILKEEKGRCYLYQSPFYEKGISKKDTWGKYEVGKIFFLRKAPETRIIRLRDKTTLFPKMSHQLVVEEVFSKSLIKNLFSCVKALDQFYLLSFTKDKESLKQIFS